MSFRIAPRIALVSLTALALAGACRAQLPDAPEPKSVPNAARFSADAPKRVLSLSSEHKFYDKPAKIMLAVGFVGASMDAAQTCHNLANGGHEDMLHTQKCSVATAEIMLGLLEQEAAAFLLHRTNHHKLERVARLFMPVNSTIGLTYSKKNGAF